MNKFLFFFKRPPVIVFVGSGRTCAKEAVFQVLKSHFKIGQDVLLLDAGEKSQGVEFFLKKSSLPILVITHIGEYHPDKGFFTGKTDTTVFAEKLTEVLPNRGFLILNFDDETVRDIKNRSTARFLTFGFGTKADMRATDQILTQPPHTGINFKINYQGNIVPIWLKKTFGKEQIYSALVAAAVGEVLELNLVEISEALRTY